MIPLRDVLFYGGGDCLLKFGTLSWRTSPGEDNPETHTRAAPAAFVDSDGVSRTAAANVPRIQWLDTDSDGVYETPTYLSGTGDVLYFPYPHPRQGVAVFVDCYWQDAIATAGALVHFGSATAATDPRLVIQSSGAYLQAVHDDGVTPCTATLAVAPTTGQRVELLVTVDPADGHVTIYQSINSAAATTATSATTVTLTAAPAAQRLYVGSAGSTLPAIAEFKSIKVARWTSGAAEPTLADMRGLFS